MNNRDYTIEHIKKDGRYSETLIKSLLNNDYRDLANLDLTIKADRNFMEPLLFAIRKELNTFAVYEHCKGQMEEDTDLATEIIVEEPELISGKKVSANKEFIKNHITTNPDIIKHMDIGLKVDNNFIKDLIENNKNNTNILNCVSEDPEILLNNPDLCNNKEIMGDAIVKNALFLKFASDELKNDRSFLEKASKQNEKIIDYVAANIDEFGLEGIKGVKTTSSEKTIDITINHIKEKAKDNTDERYGKVINKVEEKGKDNIYTMRWTTAMAAQDEKVDPEIFNKAISYSMLAIGKIDKDKTESGEIKVNKENMQELIRPAILLKLKNSLEKQGIQIDTDKIKQLEAYESFYEKYHEKYRRIQLENRKDKKLNPKDIEILTKEQTLPKIKEENSLTVIKPDKVK